MRITLRTLILLTFFTVLHPFIVDADGVENKCAEQTVSSNQAAESKETSGPDLFREKFDSPSTLWPQNEKAYVEKGKLVVKEECVAPVGGYVYEDFEATVVATLFTGVQREEKGATRSTADITSIPVIGLSFRVNPDGYYTVLLSPLGGSATEFTNYSKLSAANRSKSQAGAGTRRSKYATRSQFAAQDRGLIFTSTRSGLRTSKTNRTRADELRWSFPAGLAHSTIWSSNG